MLTGRYPRTTRIRQNGQSIPGDEQLVTRILADQGWVCGLAGKLHLSAVEGAAMERRVRDGYTTFHWSHDPRHPSAQNEYHQWLATRGVDPRSVDRHRGSLPSTFDYWCYPGPATEHHQTTWCAEQAIQFISDHQDQPWLFSLNFFDPHCPFDPPPDYLNRFDPDCLPDPHFRPDELANVPSQRQQAHEGREGIGQAAGVPFPDLTPRQRRTITAAYYAMIELIDTQVGRVLDHLDATGLADDTLVIFTSDHGEMLGDHGIYLKGPHLYEPAVRVPLIARWPNGIARRGADNALVELVDLAPTVLEAAGIRRPPGMQGRSLLPLLQRRAPSHQHRSHVYCEYYHSTPRFSDPPAYATMWRDHEVKIVVWHGQELGELYDLSDDPGEQINLWNEPTARDTRERLIRACFDASVFTMDPLPARASVY